MRNKWWALEAYVIEKNYYVLVSHHPPWSICSLFIHNNCMYVSSTTLTHVRDRSTLGNIIGLFASSYSFIYSFAHFCLRFSSFILVKVIYRTNIARPGTGVPLYLISFICVFHLYILAYIYFFIFGWENRAQPNLLCFNIILFKDKKRI